MLRLDVCGEMCPIPIVKTKVRLKSMGVGDILVVVSDHSCTTRSLVDVVRKLGHRVEVTQPEAGIWEIMVEKRR